MTVGNFTELIGTDGFDSISGSDLEIVYALDGDDVLNSALTFTGDGLPEGGSTTILVGGSGENDYQSRNNSTAIVIENNNSSDNLLWTTIGSPGISLENSSSVVAEIDNRHLFLGNTESDQYVILVDWQVPENQIETINLSEGDLSYQEFADSFRQSSNYLGSLTWDELDASGEIDLERLGLSADSIDSAIASINNRSTELESGENETVEDGIFLVGTDEGEFLDGGTGNDSLQGEGGNDGLFGFGGRDTLEGGLGDDTYFLDFEPGGGSEVLDTGGELDILFIVASNTDIEALANDPNFESLRADPSVYGDSAIALSLLEAGIVGLQKSNTDLIVDISRNGIAESENDLTIFNFFDEQGQLGAGAIETINNISDTQSIADLFANLAEEENTTGSTVYRFLNNQTGVHFYTGSETERDAVLEIPNFNFEGASYVGADPLTGQPEPVPVYRFLNQVKGVHLYTIDENERDVVDDLGNFSFEGEAFFAYETEIDGSIPIYRFFNPISGAHFYTPSAEEKNSVEANQLDFQLEGIAYYAFPVAE